MCTSLVALDQVVTKYRYLFCGQVCSGSSGVRFTLNKEKADKWLDQIQLAISEQHLDSGASQKLAGRLAWSTQFLFNRCFVHLLHFISMLYCSHLRLGRAMIKPIFAHKLSTSGLVSTRLLVALRWWSWVLQQEISELRFIICAL